ncbi:hypothetical protein [Pseudoclavibacter sp. 8L]|uniref:hypothetical protein n=1 Tax=Pseudoclavibacter sp. 8L TaxID=2653162 RepID=UPI00135A6F48|nr:hypothetical protein [Pseudoclavibacter sp. 8L]
MSQPSELQVVHAARDVLRRTRSTDATSTTLRMFAIVELNQAVHDAEQGRPVRPPVATLARRITKDEG